MRLGTTGQRLSRPLLHSARIMTPAVGRARLDPPVDHSYAVGERGGRSPAEIAPSQFRREGAACKLAGPLWGELRLDGTSRSLADDCGQVEDGGVDPVRCSNCPACRCPPQLGRPRPRRRYKRNRGSACRRHRRLAASPRAPGSRKSRPRHRRRSDPAAGRRHWRAAARHARYRAAGCTDRHTARHRTRPRRRETRAAAARSRRSGSVRPCRRARRR